MRPTLTGKRLEIYYLPEGGLWGLDEIPLHSSLTDLKIDQKREHIPVIGGDSYRNIVYGPQTTKIQLQSYGLRREIPKFYDAGARGTFATLLGDRPETLHADILVSEFNIGFGKLGFEWKAELIVNGALYTGDYTVDYPYARAQYDQADGTFLEKYLLHSILLDKLIDNRYHGWN